MIVAIAAGLLHTARSVLRRLTMTCISTVLTLLLSAAPSAAVVVLPPTTIRLSVRLGPPPPPPVTPFRARRSRAAWRPKSARISKMESANLGNDATVATSARVAGGVKGNPVVLSVRSQKPVVKRSSLPSRSADVTTSLHTRSTVLDRLVVADVNTGVDECGESGSVCSSVVDRSIDSLTHISHISVTGRSVGHSVTDDRNCVIGDFVPVDEVIEVVTGKNMEIVKCLNLPYWGSMLPLVVPASEAGELLKGLSKGVRVGRPPAISVIESRNWPSSLELFKQVSEVIDNDLTHGRLYGPFVTPPYVNYIVSPLGAFLKRNSTKARVIHDLSYPAVGSVNSEIDPEDFSLQYSSIDDAVALCNSLHPVVPMLAKVDLKDAFKHIPIDPRDWHLMGFKWPDSGGQERYFFNKVLSFGLRSAPALFDNYARHLPAFVAIEGFQSGLVRYVDDFLIVSGNAPQCQSDLDCLVATCGKAGFAIQPSKVLPPSTIMEFLGIEIDTKRSVLRISDIRLAEIKSLLSEWSGRRTCSKRQLLRLIGKLAFVARVVRKGRAFLGRLINLARGLRYLHFRTKLSLDARRDIHWWNRSIVSHNGSYIYSRDWSGTDVFHVYTDASNHGFGACWAQEYFALAYVGEFAPYGSQSINWRELHVAVKALATWGPAWEGASVVFHIDNQATCGVLSKLYTPCLDLMELARSWALLLEQYSIEVKIEYIATADNVLADALSRGRMDDYLRLSTQASSFVWPGPVAYFNSYV